VRKVFRLVLSVVKWIAMGAICLEILSFLAISATNFLFYGHAREGSRAVYDSYTLFLQSSGPRPTANNSSSPDPAKNRLVWMFGGSTMRAMTDHDDRTIPSYTSKVLNSRGSGLDFTVMNYGMNSFNSLLETKYLQKLLIETGSKPDAIVFYDGANDCKYFLEHRNAYAHHGYRRSKALIESYYRSWFGLMKPLNAALFSSFTKELYDKINQVFVPLSSDSPELKQLVDATEKRYDYLAKVADCFGSRFTLVWQPLIWVEECRVPESVEQGEKNLVLKADRFATMRSNFMIPYLAIAKRLENKPYFVSFRNVLCERKEPAYQPDGVHLTDAGRELVARHMAPLVEKRMVK